VFHDASVQSSAEQQFNSYIEYGGALEKLVADVQGDLRARKAA
jgi:hypothetical protein